MGHSSWGIHRRSWPVVLEGSLRGMAFHKRPFLITHYYSPLSSHPHRLGVQKLPNPHRSQLPPVPRLLHPAERNPRIGRYHLVDEHHPCFQFVDEALALLVIVRPCARSQSEAHIVGNPDRLVLILHPEDRCHWTKEFLAVCGRIFWNVSQHRRCVEVPLPFQRMPTRQQLGSRLDSFLHIHVESSHCIGSGQRTKLSLLVKRITDFKA